MAEQSVTLAPGESKVVAFKVTPTEARVYHVEVNGLSGSFVATKAVPPVPCVYCGATFAAEAELIAHMGTKHPGRPYLVSMQLLQPSMASSRQGSLTYAPTKVKMYIPDSDYYQFHFWIYNEDCASGISLLNKPAGFYESSGSILGYGVEWYVGYFYVPAGTYAIKTSCVRIITVGGVPAAQWIYRGVDTGLTIEVV